MFRKHEPWARNILETICTGAELALIMSLSEDIKCKHTKVMNLQDDRLVHKRPVSRVSSNDGPNSSVLGLGKLVY